MRSHRDLGYEVEFAHLYGFSSTQYRMVDGVGAPHIHHTLDHNARRDTVSVSFIQLHLASAGGRILYSQSDDSSFAI